MTEITITRSGNGFMPVDPAGFEVMEGFAYGVELKAKLTKPRNQAFHRMFMGAVRFLFSHRDDYSIFEEFRKDVTIKLGHYTMETVRGKLKPIAKSISFASMDDISFREFFEGFVKLACNEIVPGLPESTMWGFYEILDGNSGKQGQAIPQHRQAS